MTYKQLGNGVNVGAVYNVIRAQVLRDIDLLSEYPDLVREILGAPPNPDLILGTHSEFHKSSHATKNLALDFEEPLRLVK
jgi:DNA (cytosine-5)-methyltransferase 1